MVQKAGVPLEEAIRMSSETPAKLMHVFDRKGSIEIGKDADIAVYDSDLNIQAVWTMGNLATKTSL